MKKKNKTHDDSLAVSAVPRSRVFFFFFIFRIEIVLRSHNCPRKSVATSIIEVCQAGEPKSTCIVVVRH